MLRYRLLQKALSGGIAPPLLSGMLITVVIPANALDSATYARFNKVGEPLLSGQVLEMGLCRGSGYAKGHERRQTGVSRVSQCLH